MFKLFYNKSKFHGILSAIKEADSILIFTHINPDGDALGSLISLNLALKNFNKKIFPIILEQVSRDLEFLPGTQDLILIDDFKKSHKGNLNNFLAISVDVSDEQRLGAAIELFRSAGKRILFDHHATNNGFAEINYIDPSACATGLMIYDFIKETKISIGYEMAINLYTAIATDTGNFSFASTDSRCFLAMSDICKTKFPLAQINHILFKLKSEKQLRILSIALSNLKIFANNRAAYLTLNREEIKSVQASNEHISTIINNIIDIEGVDIVFFAHEILDGSIRVSFRSKEPYRVDTIAKKHNGGGHANASGCSFNIPIKEVVDILCKELETELLRVNRNDTDTKL